MPYYSFVMLCYNKWELTKQAITTLVESLSISHKNKEIELIIVNNGSSDETKEGIEQIKKLYSHEIEVVPVHLKENMGYPVGVNMGLEHYKGEIITIVNNDLVFPENWFDGIVNTLASDPLIGVAAPFLSYGSGPEHLGVSFASLNEMRKFAKHYMEENKDKKIYSERIIGACISFKKEVLELIGGNDFWFGLGLYDDDDWSLRAGIAGYKSVITGASFVHHIGTVTFHQQSDTLASAFRANYPKFTRKWLKSGADPANRKAVIKNTKYSKQEHYFPCKIDDFNEITPSNMNDPNVNKTKMIIVADWSNDRSQWRNRLLNLNCKLPVDGNNLLYLWIPKTYFRYEEIVNEVEKILDKNTSCVHYLFDEVPPIDLLKFFSKYDVFLEVEDDYVNRHFKYLLAHASLEIQ